MHSAISVLTLGWDRECSRHCGRKSPRWIWDEDFTISLHRQNYFSGFFMTKIIVKPMKENSKKRRYQLRGEVMARRREDAELARKIRKAWAKLTYTDSPVKKVVYNGSHCLQEVARYCAGHRKSKNITAK